MSISSMITVDCGTFTAVGQSGRIEGRVVLEVDYEKAGLLVVQLHEGRKTVTVLFGAAERAAFASQVAAIKLDVRKLPAAQLLARPEWLGIVGYSSNREVILTGGGKGRGGAALASLEVDAAMQTYVRMSFMDGNTEITGLLGGKQWLEFLTCWRCLAGHVSKLTAGGNFHGFTALTPGTL